MLTLIYFSQYNVFTARWTKVILVGDLHVEGGQDNKNTVQYTQ